jgi:hypothetical protein
VTSEAGTTLVGEIAGGIASVFAAISTAITVTIEALDVADAAFETDEALSNAAEMEGVLARADAMNRINGVEERSPENDGDPITVPDDYVRVGEPTIEETAYGSWHEIEADRVTGRIEVEGVYIFYRVWEYGCPPPNTDTTEADTTTRESDATSEDNPDT